MGGRLVFHGIEKRFGHKDRLVHPLPIRCQSMQASKIDQRNRIGGRHGAVIKFFGTNGQVIAVKAHKISASLPVSVIRIQNALKANGLRQPPGIPIRLMQ